MPVAKSYLRDEEAEAVHDTILTYRLDHEWARIQVFAEKVPSSACCDLLSTLVPAYIVGIIM